MYKIQHVAIVPGVLGSKPYRVIRRQMLNTEASNNYNMPGPEEKRAERQVMVLQARSCGAVALQGRGDRDMTQPL